MTQRLLSLAYQLDQATMRQVFTHTSWAPDRVHSYERLEFLGDSVLSLCITTELYRRFPDHAEGHLARLRAYIVSRATCARVATKLGLGKLLRQYAGSGPEGNDAAQLQSNQNVLADLTESLIGAVYLTFGYEAVRPAVIEVFDEHITYAENSYIDHKTELQEFLARSGQSVAYKVVGFSGPPHSREFEIEAAVDGESLGRGFGTSKKRAEQEAAAEALHEMQARARRSARRARLRGSRSRRAQGQAGRGEAGAAGLPEVTPPADAADAAAAGEEADTAATADEEARAGDAAPAGEEARAGDAARTGPAEEARTGDAAQAGPAEEARSGDAAQAGPAEADEAG